MDTHNVPQSDESDNQDKNCNSLSSIEPSALSKLLKEHGPLAMRHITRLLSEVIPQFQGMSSSKKRRMIMNTLEKGDEKNQVLFQKIGWGLWQIETVDPSVSFEQQRQIVNSMNKKRKDSISNEIENVIINKSIFKKDTKSDGLLTCQTMDPPKSVYIDEYALSISSEEEEENLDENQIDNMEYSKPQVIKNRRGSSAIYSIKTRKSSVMNSSKNIILQPTINPNIKVLPLFPTTLLSPQKGHAMTKSHRSLSNSNKPNSKNIPEKKHLYHHHTPIQRVRSMSISKESSLRSTLNHFKTNSTKPINSNHIHINIGITPLTSTSQFSLKLETDNMKEEENWTSSSQNLELEKSLDFLLGSRIDEMYKRSNDKFDPEDKIWKNTSPRISIRKHTEEPTTTNYNNDCNTVMNTAEIADLLLSLK